jgi:hypothetical protein
MPSSSGESNGTDLVGAPANQAPMAYEDWVHEFRNALGNITIAASAARSELAKHQSLQTSALMRQIEKGCDRCLRLLRTMPR